MDVPRIFRYPGRRHPLARLLPLLQDAIGKQATHDQ